VIIKDYLKELFDTRILYDELSVLNENVPLKDQIYSLKEDLLQVESITLVGIQSLIAMVFFKLIIIKKYDWENPIFKTIISDTGSLKEILRECKLTYLF
jgi:hypothetical protein